MKIDWKALSKSPGYVSLKAAYIELATTRRWTSKEEVLKAFNFVICRAKHYSHHTGKSVEEVLMEWEVKRSNQNLVLNSFYSDNHWGQPKYTSGVLKPVRIKGIRNRTKKAMEYRNSPVKRKAANLRFIMRKQKEASKKTPKRWIKEQKVVVAYWRKVALKRCLNTGT